MPELPEVETVRRGLEPVMGGRTIAEVTLNRPDLRFPLPAGLADRLRGQRIATVGRRAKYLLIGLADGMTLGVHLGMSGRFVIRGGGAGGEAPRASSAQAGAEEGWALRAAHDHVVIGLEGGPEVVFNDPRRFGYMFLAEAGALETVPHLAALGPEPLGNRFDGPYLLATLAGRRAPIKAALLDQRVVAGLGNIYVCEALFRSGISPRRGAGTLGPARCDRLVASVRAVLTEAIEAGGSSLRDYVRASGELGYFQHRFRVYGREDERCVTPGCGRSIRRIVQSGRSTFYCSACQR